MGRWLICIYLVARFVGLYPDCFGLCLPISMSLQSFSMGLDFSLLRTPAGIFCFLHGFFVVVGGGVCRLVVVVGRVVHYGVFCRRFGDGNVFFVSLSCVVGRFRHVLFCAGCVYSVHGAAGLATTKKATGDGRKIFSLWSVSDGDVVWNCFERSVLHLLHRWGWCSIISLVGLLLSDWALPVRRPVSEPGESEDYLGRSLNKWHTYGVLLWALKIFSSIRVLAVSFIHSSSSLREMEKAWPATMVVGDGEDRKMLLM